MWIRLEKYVANYTRTINRKKIEKSYGYTIVIYRIFRKKRYVRFLPGWLEALNNDEQVSVQLTRHIGEATHFRDSSTQNKALAETIICYMRKEPHRFILG